jgi:hypothetical protein
VTHRRTKRPPPVKPPTGYCTHCGKVVYYKRADAKAAAKTLGLRQRVYPCPENESHYHRATWQPQGRIAFYRQRDERVRDEDAEA